MGLRERELQQRAGGGEIEVSAGSGEGRAGRGSRGDMRMGAGRQSGRLWENKIKAVPDGNKEGKGRWPGLLVVVGRQPLSSQPGGCVMSPPGDSEGDWRAPGQLRT